MAIVTLRYLGPVDTLLVGAGWHVLLSSYLQYVDGIAVISFAAPACLLVVAVWQPRIYRARSDTGTQWRLEIDGSPFKKSGHAYWPYAFWLLNKSSGSMLVLGLSSIACIAVFFTLPIGSNVACFSIVLLVMAAVIAPCTLRPVFNFSFDVRPAQRLLRGTLALFLGLAAVQFFWGMKNAVSDLYRSAFSLPSNTSVGGFVIGSLRKHHYLLAAVHEQSLKTPWSLLKQDILSKSGDGGALAVHAIPTVDDFWRRLSPQNPWWCISSQLMIPAELGIVQILDIAPKSIETQCVSEGIVFYGFGNVQDLHRTASLSDAQLCEAAGKSKLARVYVINSIKDLQRNVVLDRAAAGEPDQPAQAEK